MGEIAEMMLDGTLDEMTGEYLGPGPGYPRSLDRDHWSNQREFGFRSKGQPNHQAGVFNWLSNRKCPVDPADVIRRYQDEVLHLEGAPKVKTICKHIQKDFKGFTDWYTNIKSSLK